MPLLNDIIADLKVGINITKYSIMTAGSTHDI